MEGFIFIVEVVNKALDDKNKFYIFAQVCDEGHGRHGVHCDMNTIPAGCRALTIFHAEAVPSLPQPLDPVQVHLRSGNCCVL